MKKFIKLFSLMILIIGLFINIDIVNAKDVSNGFRVTDFKICKDKNCTVIYDEENGKLSNDNFYVKLDWEYDGEEIEDGDFVTFKFANDDTKADLENQIFQSTYSGSYSNVDIKDTSGNIIGKYTLSSARGSSKNIKITFSNNSVGRTYLSGNLTVGPIADFTRTVVYDHIINLTVGDGYEWKIVKKMKILHQTLNPTNGAANGFYSAGYPTNNSITFIGRSPSVILAQLFNSKSFDDGIYEELSDNVKCDSLIFEAFFDYGTVKEDIGTIGVGHATLASEGHLFSGTSGGSWELGYGKAKAFGKVSYAEGMSYEEFKNSIEPYHYGIYKNGTASVVIVNYGDMPSSRYTYKDLWGENYIDTKILTDAEMYTRCNNLECKNNLRDIFNRGIGDLSLVNNHVSAFHIQIPVSYPQVYEDTSVSSVGYWTCDGVKKKELTAKGTMIAPDGTSTTPLSGEVQVLVRNRDTKIPLSNGVKFNLLKKNSNNTFSIIQSDIVPDESGLIRITDLDDGVYKIEQTGFLENYDRTSFKMFDDKNMKDANIISDFTINGDGKKLYISNIKEKVQIKFKSGTVNAFDEITKTFDKGDPITFPDNNNELHIDNTTNKTEDNWELIGWSPNVEFIVTSPKTYTALWKKEVNLIQHYCKENTDCTNNGDKIKSDVSKVVEVGKNYSVTRADNGIPSKYIYVTKNSVAESGTVPDGNIEIIYYYKLKPAIIKVKHLEEETNDVLASEETINKKYDDTYTTSKNNTLKNYNMIRISGDPVSGTVSKDSYEIIYYYKKKDPNITIDFNNPKDTTDDVIENQGDAVHYNISNSINVSDYIGKGKIEIVDQLPYEIDVEKSDLAGGVYNKENKTITWTVTWDGVDSFNNNGVKNINKDITLVYKDVDPNSRVLTNNITSTVTLDNKTSTNSYSVNTLVQIKGKVIIKYLDEDDNELTNSIEIEDLVGEMTSSNELEFEGFDLISNPESEVHQIKAEITEVIYRYKKKVFNIEVESASGGKVTGAGSVKYGEDSNDIVITSDEGYCIDKIIVDDKEINVVNCKNQILDKFTNVKENHNIKVTFKKNVITTNPLTGSLLKIACLIILIGISSVLIINNKKLIKNN